MKIPYVKYTTCESGEWAILDVTYSDGRHREISGHSIPDFQWINVIKNLGCEIEEECISDEEMELRS